MGIGENTQIEGAIIDKNACIGKGVVIRSFPRGTDLDSENWVVRDGIVVIPKNAVLMDGTYIGPDQKIDLDCTLICRMSKNHPGSINLW